MTAIMPWLAELVAKGPAGAVQRLAELQGVPAGSVLTEGAPSALHQAAVLHSFRWVHCRRVCGEAGGGGGGRERVQFVKLQPQFGLQGILKV